MDTRCINEVLKSIGYGELYYKKGENSKLLAPVPETVTMSRVDIEYWSFGTYYYLYLSNGTRHEIPEHIYHILKQLNHDMYSIIK